MAATNSYTNMAELIKDYIAQDVDDYLEQSITVNNVTLSCDVYRVADGTSLTSAIFTGCTENDDHTQIVVGRNLSVASGVTLTPPYRCKGLFIGSAGEFINDGTISMTARGASASGQNIALVDEYSIAATGGSGGTGNGGSGSSASSLSCAGGGSGGYNSKSSGANSGAGGSGTSYSGGAGGGGNGGINTTAAAGSSTGGAGGAGASGSAGFTYVSCGGAGNPGGTTSKNYTGTVTDAESGTGGLLVIFADVLNQNGTVISNGSNGGAAPNVNTGAGGGGGSGGGCIVLLSKVSNTPGSYGVRGGAGGNAYYNGTYSYGRNGGSGGNGKYAAYTVSDMEIAAPIDLSLALTKKEYLDDIDPVDGRFMGLMDGDELYYEFGGERHRTVNTDAGFEDCHTRGEQVPDEIEVLLTNVQNGQVLVYDSTTQKFKNRDAGYVYSTDEKVVGIWIDGRPVYERTFIGVLPTISSSSEVISIIESMPNADYTVISTEGSVSWEISSSHKGTVITPWCAGSSNYICFHQYSNNFTLVSCGTHFSGASYRAITKYVKTIDTPTV